MGGLHYRELVAGVLAAAIACSGSAFAKPPRDVAAESVAANSGAPDAAGGSRELQLRGDRAMLEMRYFDALRLYEQVQALDPANVGVDYSIARAHQMLAEFPEALTALERFQQRASVEQRATVGYLPQLFADLRSRVSTLHLDCNQAGARVLVRDRVIGTTPLPRNTLLSAGAATIQVELDGFFPARKEIVLPGGGVLDLRLELHAHSKSALLVVNTKPSGATVLVDGQRLGTSSPSVERVVAAGSHRVTALRDGYERASVPVVLGAGSTRSVTVSLEPSTPVTRRWWFWTGLAVVAAGGATLTAALLTERGPGHGSLSPGQVRAPLEIGF